MQKLFQKIKAPFNAQVRKNSGAYPVVIETPRLILRELQPGDAARIQEITSKPGFKYYCFDGTQEKVDAFLGDAVKTRAIASDGKRTEIMLAVVLKETGELIGHASLQRVHYIPGYDFDANFFIDPDHQKKGYGREAIVNVQRFGYEQMGLPGYTCTVHPDNTASRTVFKTEAYREIGEIKMQTVFGEEPRVLVQQNKDEFYARRQLDKQPLLLDKTTKTAANNNKPAAARKFKKG